MAKSRRERFEEVAARRVQKVIESMESLSKCSNPANYEYDEADVSKMLDALNEKMKSLEAVFRSNLPNNGDTFKF